jgi:hypothetical protein
MEWTFTAAAERKILRASGEYFIFGEAVQQIASEYDEFASRLLDLQPHITVYDPTSARDALADERISDSDALQVHDIDLSGEGGAQLICSHSNVLVSVFAGDARYPSLAREIERILESPLLAISMTFSIRPLSHSRAGNLQFDQASFLAGQPLFLGKLPDLSLVRRATP